MKRPYIFKYTKVGPVCFVDVAEMERLYKALKRLGVESKTIPPNIARSRRFAARRRARAE